MSNETKHTPGPWRWKGEDYRGGWGWQLLVGPNDEGILCGEGPDGKPYKHLRAYVPIDPEYTKTGFYSNEDSAPCVHVLEADAKLIASAPDLLKENQELKALSRELLTAIEQSQFFTDGFSKGSASISEVRNAYSEQHKAYSALWDYLKSKAQ